MTGRWSGRIAAFFGAGSEPLDTGVTLTDVLRASRASGLPLTLGENEGGEFLMFVDDDGLKIRAPDGSTMLLMEKT